jgi:opacity protein-like surface antigen
MRSTISRTLVFLVCLLAPFVVERAQAQARSSSDLAVRGFASGGLMIFSASESFDAVLGKRSLPTFGGGIEVVLRDNIFIGVGAWRASQEGERVFVGPDDEVFPLGIGLNVKVTPIELTGGWRFTNVSRRFVPYIGGGFSSFKYSEDTDTSESDDDVDERFSGGHLLGGVEVRVSSWIGVSGEVVWTTIPDALGEAGASKAFDETNLGGTAIRVKVVVGR